jgi:hypothetical protein
MSNLVVPPFEFPEVVTHYDIPATVTARERTTPLGRTYTTLDCEICGWYTRVWWDKTENVQRSLTFRLTYHKCIEGMKKPELIEQFKETNNRACHAQEARDMYMSWWEEARREPPKKKSWWRGNR